LNCFLDTRLARGYLAWVAPAPGIFQAGFATNATVKSDLKAFHSYTQGNFGLSRASVHERLSGLILCTGPFKNFTAPNFLLIEDAAGHISLSWEVAKSSLSAMTGAPAS
jgi:digeranylgeranylglycerophospholipid reductase